MDNILVEAATDIYIGSVGYICYKFNNSLVMEHDTFCFEDTGLNPFL